MTPPTYFQGMKTPTPRINAPAHIIEMIRFEMSVEMKLSTVETA